MIGINKIRFTVFVYASLFFLTIGCKKESFQPTVTDVDGNVYKIVTIGTQTWMAENLKTTKYRNGDPINYVTDGKAWSSLTEGAYCYCNNDEATNKKDYGALYNWHAVNDIRNLAPEGWHIPTDAEWEILTTYLGGLDNAGGKLKEKGILHWVSPNTNATNENGFTALPGGSRAGSASLFYDFGHIGSWWSSTDSGALGVWNRSMSFYYSGVFRGAYSKQNGFSVRCVKD